MNTEKKIIDWNYKLQHELEKMTKDEFENFIKKHLIKYNNKIYGRKIEKKKLNKKIKQ